MKRVYTWTAQPANRTVTVKGMREGKGFRKWTQVTANSAEEAVAAKSAGIDMLIGHFRNTKAVRKGSCSIFLQH